MLRSSVNFCRYCHKHFLNLNRRGTASINSTEQRWDLFGAVCVERKPIITPELTATERTFQTYLNEVELEKSMKSKHEVRHEQDLLQAELLKKGDMGDIDLDSTLKQTAQDFEDACIEELSQFKFTKRLLGSEDNTSVTSVSRKMDRHLVLLVGQTIGKKQQFLLPQIIREDGETMRQTAERALKQSCGTDIQVKFYGNAPAGFYKYKYPKELQQSTVGAKVFIYFARYMQGDVENKSTSCKWLDRHELEQDLPAAYHESISKLLVDETFVAS